LKNQWNVKVLEETDKWTITINAPTVDYDVYIPDEANVEGKAVFVNGKKKA
jgi:hypothetical protein